MGGWQVRDVLVSSSQAAAAAVIGVAMETYCRLDAARERRRERVLESADSVWREGWK